MFIFNYCDYFYISIIIFLFFIGTIVNICYINFKCSVVEKMNYAQIFYLNFKLVLFFLFFNVFIVNYFNVYFYTLNLILIYKFFIYCFGFLCLFLFEAYSKIVKLYKFEYIWIFMFSLFSLSVLMQSSNFLNFYVLLECYSLNICSLLVLKKLNKKILDASFKYLIYSTVSSCLLLLGISNLYFSLGLINFIDIIDSLVMFKHLYFKNIFYWGCLLFVLGFSMKLAIFPFSFYLKEIYASLPVIYLFFLLLVPKLCFILFLIKLTFFCGFVIYSTPVLFYLYLSFITSTLHAIFSINSSNLKNILVNTSFSNAPFLLLPIFFKSYFVLNSFLTFFLIYFFTLFSVFSILFIFLTNKNQILKKIFSLSSLYYLNLPLCVILVFNFLSLSSLPPFSGFFVKFYLFYFFIEYKMFYLYIIMSIINLFLVYTYLRIIRLFFLKKRNYFLKYLVVKKSSLLFFVVVFTYLNFIYLFGFDYVYSLLFIFSHSVSLI